MADETIHNPLFTASLFGTKTAAMQAEIESLRSEVDELKTACLAARAILGFGDLHPKAESVPIPKLIVACAKKADAAFTECESELAALRKTYADSESNLHACDAALQSEQVAHAALRKRFEEAPVVWIANGACEYDGARLCVDGGDNFFTPPELIGKRVRLVEDEPTPP